MKKKDISTKKKINKKKIEVEIATKPTGNKEYIICKKCGCKNKPKVTICAECGNSKFQPSWVKEHRKVNRAISVDITQSNPSAGERKNRISLNKFFPGIKTQNFNISSPEHWESIKRIIDEDLAPQLGWKKKNELIKAVEKELSQPKTKKHIQKSSSGEMNSLLEQYPQFTGEFLNSISEILKDADFEKVNELLRQIAKATTKYDEVFFASLKSLFEKLKGEDKISLATFGELLKEWNLKQITDVTKEVKRRLAELDLFIQKNEDEKTYEIRGDDSIHRILERSMWLIDEKYWIIQSNRQLRTFIGNELAKEDKKFEKNRPDFACGTYDNTIVIIEIKRPSHTLFPEDLDQLVSYLMLAKKYLGSKKYSFKAMLIGNSKSTDLEAKMDWTRGIDLLTYNDLVQDCKKRYKDFLKHIAD